MFRLSQENINRMETLVKMQVVVIIIMSIRKKVTKEIDWNALDKWWGDRYEEEYGHYFSDRSYIDITTPSPVIAAFEAIY